MKKYNKLAFTLVEVLVSITIFSIMIISIMSIYTISADITMKSDINRILQENIKSVSNKIAEDIRKNGIVGVSDSITDECDIETDSNKYKEGKKLCTKSGNKYYLAKLDKINDIYVPAELEDCSSIESICVITMGLNAPLTNSFVTVRDLNFYVSKDYIPKVTMNITMQPAVNKGVKANLIKESKITFQTTISERPF